MPGRSLVPARSHSIVALRRIGSQAEPGGRKRQRPPPLFFSLFTARTGSKSRRERRGLVQASGLKNATGDPVRRSDPGSSAQYYKRLVAMCSPFFSLYASPSRPPKRRGESDRPTAARNARRDSSLRPCHRFLLSCDFVTYHLPCAPFPCGPHTLTHARTAKGGPRAGIGGHARDWMAKQMPPKMTSREKGRFSSAVPPISR